MKAFLLATAMIAAPVFAQSTTMPATDPAAPAATDQPMTTTPDTTTPSGDMTQSPAQSTNSGTPPAAPAPGAPMETTTTPMAPAAPMTTPAAPMQGNMTSDPSMDPGATTAPADPPFCKAGQYDDCKERSTKNGARHPSQPK